MCWLLQSAHAHAQIITNAADIQFLSAAEAAERRPVCLRAVMIDESAPREAALLVADETGGIYVLAATNLFAPFHRGDLLELTGFTDPGGYAPIMIVRAVKKLGTAPLPTPRPITYSQVISGAMDAQWIEVSGIVRQYEGFSPSEGISRMAVSLDGGLLHVRLVGPQGPDLQVDAEVRVQAICFYQHNQNRQMVGPVLQVPAGFVATILKPAPADPFAAPVRLAANLRQFSPVNTIGHRIHVRGVVTHCQPGSSVWIRDETAGLHLQTRASETLVPGDMIDALGFPKLDSTVPNLEDAVFHKLGTTNPPFPIIIVSATNAINFADDLVSLEADLKEIVYSASELTLAMEVPGKVFKAVLNQPDNPSERPNWQPGSRVRIVGICSVTYDESKPLMGISRPQSFQILLRSPADLTILRAPSWWTLKHISFLLGIALVATLLVTGAIMMVARRRLREQEQQRAMAEAEFTAILSERNRVAREIHDTLAQGLTATSVQLQLVENHANGASKELVQHLNISQKLVRDSLEEARNSIWNMRSQILETGNLASALESILSHMLDGTNLKTDVKVTGRERRLAPVIENNLLRVGQEAITNAAKHARAKHIKVTLDFGEKELTLKVVDDGCGFDPANPRSSDGGFGLIGMKERVAELKGKLNIHSSSGLGTEIVLSVPLSDK